MKLLRTVALAAALGAVAAPAAQAEMKPEERSVLRSEIRAYLLEHPEVLVEAMRVLEERRKEAEAAGAADLIAKNADEIFSDGYSYVGGNPDGDVTMVEFLDYNCGYCKRAHDEVHAVLEQDGGIRFVVKEFPILGPTSMIAAQAALASLRQADGAHYPRFTDALMRNRGTLTEEQIWNIAEESGLDVEQLRTDAESDEIKVAIQRNYDLAQKLDINGTPGFVIGDRMVKGYIPLEQMMQVVAEVRSASD